VTLEEAAPVYISTIIVLASLAQLWYLQTLVNILGYP
jgi:hypothetical protein